MEKEKLYQESKFKNEHQKINAPQKKQEAYDFMVSKFWPKIFDVDPEEYLDEQELQKQDNAALPIHNTIYNAKFKEQFIKKFDDQAEHDQLHGAEKSKVGSKIASIMQEVDRSIKYLEKKGQNTKVPGKKLKTAASAKSRPSKPLSGKQPVTAVHPVVAHNQSSNKKSRVS